MVIMHNITLTFERRTVGSRPLAIRRISDIHHRPRPSEKKSPTPDRNSKL